MVGGGTNYAISRQPAGRSRRDPAWRPSPRTQARVRRSSSTIQVSPAFKGSFGSAGPYYPCGTRLRRARSERSAHAIIQDITRRCRAIARHVRVHGFRFIGEAIDIRGFEPPIVSRLAHRSGPGHDRPLRARDRRQRLSSGWQCYSSGQTVPGPKTIMSSCRLPGTPMVADHAAVPGAHPQCGRPKNSTMIIHSNPGALSARYPRYTRRASPPMLRRPSTGKIGASADIASADWVRSPNAAPENPFPRHATRPQICLKNGFDPKLLYQVVFTARTPRVVLGIRVLRLFRMWGSFFRNAAQDDAGNAQSCRHRSFMGDHPRRSAVGQFPYAAFSSRLQPTSRTQVYELGLPIIARPAIALNSASHAGWRAEAFEPGSEARNGGRLGQTMPVRGLPAAASSIAAARAIPAQNHRALFAPRKLGASS